MDAETAEEAIEQAIEEGGDNWIEDDREEWASTAEAKRLDPPEPAPEPAPDDFLEARYDDQFGAGELE
ncbi:MAG: hypothetical protein ABSC06_35870 [Rhodopila sp.]